MPPAAASKRKKDGHKDHQQVRLSGPLYEAMKKLAQRNERPLLWEVRIALKKHLKEQGLWTSEDEAEDDTTE